MYGIFGTFNESVLTELNKKRFEDLGILKD
jgi:hypothetical protein